MSTNSDVAQIFYAIADLLDLQNERFKPEAYRRAARSIEALGEDLRRVAQRGGLDKIPGVGEAIREKILEYLKEGKISYYERLKQQFPPGVLELMRIPGIGPKTTGRFYSELHVQSPEELARAIDEGRLNGLPGFGEKKIEKLRQALAQARGAAEGGDSHHKGIAVGRTPLHLAWKRANEMLGELRARAPVHDMAAAGSLRRRRENVGDLDLLVTSEAPAKVLSAFVQLPGVRTVVLQGDTKATVLYTPGIQIDLRVVAPESFGAALQYFTGSKDHNIHLRSLARDRGLKINEYGVFRGEERVGGRTEEEVYKTLGLPVIPAEIRENRGEIEAALEHRLPTLVDLDHLRGELHRHLPPGTDRKLLNDLAEEARKRKFRYLGLVLPDSDAGPAQERLLETIREFRRSLGKDGPRLFVGREVPLEKRAGQPPTGTDVDYLIGRPAPGARTAPSGRPTGAPLFVGHLGLGAPGGEVPRDLLPAWIDWCRSNGVALEVTPDGAADGLDSGAAQRAATSGVALLLSAGGERPTDLEGLELAVGLARRGWVAPGNVLNARIPGGAGPPRATPSDA